MSNSNNPIFQLWNCFVYDDSCFTGNILDSICIRKKHAIKLSQGVRNILENLINFNKKIGRVADVLQYMLRMIGQM